MDKPYIVQFKAAGDETWDDGLTFDDLAQARQHVQAVIAASDTPLVGRICDRLNNHQVLETHEE